MADDELEGLKAANGERLANLAQQGVQIAGLREGYMLRLLEHIVGSDLEHVQLIHERWVSTEIDKATARITRARPLGQPMPTPKGN